jgi:hypothetical protein
MLPADDNLGMGEEPPFGADDSVLSDLLDDLLPPAEPFRHLVLSTPPVSFDLTAGGRPWGMMGNSGNCGDCVVAAAGHLVQAFTAARGAKSVIPDQDIIQVYENLTGWDPTKPSEKLGITRLVNCWKTKGIGGHLLTHASPSNAVKTARAQAKIKSAVFHFGGAYITTYVPTTGWKGWPHVAAWDNGNMGAIAGLHSVPILGYDDVGCTIVTWGTSWRMSWSFVDAYLHELWAVISPDWVDANTPSPNGTSLADLTAGLGNWAA